MNDAIAELEKKKSIQKARKRHGQGSKSSSEKTSGHKAPVSDTAACDSQEAASCSHSNITGQRKVDSKAPFHPQPLHAASQSASPEPHPSQLPPASQPNCEVKEVKSSLSQTEERASNNYEEAAKYPKEFDAVGEKEPDDMESSLSSENASDLSKETTVKDAKLSDGECMNKNLDEADRNNNLTKNGDPNISKNDSRDDDRGTTVPLKKPLVQNEPVLKKAKRHVPFAGKTLKRTKGKESSKPKEGYHSGICASGVRISVNNGGDLRVGTVMSQKQHVQDEAVLKRTKSYDPVDLEESSKQQEGDDGHCSTPGQAPSLSDGLSNVEARSIPSAEASPSKKEVPLNQEESTPDTSDPEALTPSEAAGSLTVVHSAVPEEGIVVKDVESSNPIQKNQHEREVFKELHELPSESKSLFFLPPKKFDSCIFRIN